MCGSTKKTVICSACKEKMTSADWQAHNCEFTLEPLKGESWEDYSARCDANEARIKNANPKN